MEKYPIIIPITASVIIGATIILYKPSNNILDGASREIVAESVYIEDMDSPLSIEYISDETKKLAFDCFVKVNTFRQAEGLQPLEWNDDLEKCASIRAEEISEKFSHTRPNNEPWYTVNENIMYAENLAKGYKDVDSCFDAWRKSETHNANIMDKELKSIGIYVTIKDNTYYWVQEFGY